MGFGQASNMIAFAPDTQLTSIIDNWGPYYVSRVQSLIDGTWESSDTWGGMDTGMVEMAPFTNMPFNVQLAAESITEKILTGKFKPFGDTSVGELLGMSEYLEGIDAAKP